VSILAVETSCDDTCAAVLEQDGTIRSNVISSQEQHSRFGGVVPEIASRHHLELIDAVIDEALRRAGSELEEVELVAATQGPGLIGALLVGLSSAKAIAAARELPFAAVDHLQGHVAANFLRSDEGGGDGSGGHGSRFEPPFVCLIASGGHTLLARVSAHDGFEVLGSTLDDAAGEAFDKGARMLGLGFPGGAALERLAAGGDPGSFSFPGSPGERRRGRSPSRAAFAEGLDFSFAGVKTALLYRLRELSEEEREERAGDLAASYQAAIVESLLSRTERALLQSGLDRLAVGGGVAANGELRRRLQELDVEVHVPERALCTDNAAMIASAARFTERLEYPHYLALDAYASGERP
jgi:tRNA N6-adenosine threonylcarbamoyltransferase